MKSVTLQFHATRSDIYSMAGRWSEEAACTIVGEILFPVYRIRTLSAADLKESQESFLEDVARVSLQRGTVDLHVASAMEYIQKNPNGFTIDIGRLVEGFLYESSLGAMTDDSESMKIWRRLKARAKRSMSKGAWIVNAASGARDRDDSHSYTAAARELQDAGIIMVGHTDWIRYELD